MNLPPIEPTEQMPDNLILLSEAREKYRTGACQHMRIEVDEQLNTVRCRDCNEQLSAIGTLVRFCKEESRWNWERQNYIKAKKEYQQLDQELAAKHRCKCEHCKKMTKIDRRVSTLRVVK